MKQEVTQKCLGSIKEKNENFTKVNWKKIRNRE